MIQLTYYVPVKAHEHLKQKLFDAGAGKHGNYDQCCWHTLGQGQYRPLAGSTPNLGQLGQLQQLQEYKVEMICEKKSVEAVLAALFQNHPYEQPAYMLIDSFQSNTVLTEKQKSPDC